MSDQRRRGLHQFRHAEVQQLHVPVGPQHDVLGLHITVHDAGAVRHVERRRDLSRDVDGVDDRERPAAKTLSQRLALDQLRDDERPAIVRADVVDRDDVRMIESRGGAWPRSRTA